MAEYAETRARSSAVVDPSTAAAAAAAAAASAAAGAAGATAATAPMSSSASCTMYLRRVLLGLTAQLPGADSRARETVLLAVEPVLAHLLKDHRHRHLHTDSAHSIEVSS